MQSTRLLAAPLLRQQAATTSSILRQHFAPTLRRQTVRNLRLQATPRLAFPADREVGGQSAHTITQRLRTLKKIPVEIWPLIVVLAAAVGAAGYSLVNKLVSDKTLRLSRQGPHERGH